MGLNALMSSNQSFWTKISKIVYAASDPKRGFTSVPKNILHPDLRASCAGKDENFIFFPKKGVGLIQCIRVFGHGAYVGLFKM